MNIKDLKGKRLKKLLNFNRAIKRYHNKNKSGGNFGFTLVKITPSKRKEEVWLTLDGVYDTEGRIRILSFSTFDYRQKQVFEEIPQTIEDLALKMKEPLKRFEEYLANRSW